LTYGSNATKPPRKKLAARITAFNTSDIVLGTVDGFPPWPGEVSDARSC
jgi:hypothetical protein